MDAPGETPLESSSDAGLERNRLPELSRSQATLSAAESYSQGPPLPSPPDPVSSVVVPALRKQKSVRTRPAEALERQHAAPPSPLRDRPTPPAQQPKPKVSKMSLFNLFSKPKVEKLRGWAEPGLDAPSRTLSHSDAVQSKPNIVVRVADVDAQDGRVRPTTSKSYSSRGLRMMPSKESLPPSLTTDRRLRPFDPPPLFQVWPQATKHGKFEVTIVAPEMVLQKSKNRVMGASLLVPGGDIQSPRVAGNRDSFESRTTVKSAFRHVANGSISGINLPTKIFVLTTSGCLLQYGESGPSDRYPERILQLARTSAAYASDLIPGKHYVLQVEQAIDQDGTVVANSPSFFSKLGIRSQTTRRMTSNFLIVMPGPKEMEDWMTTIRREIERLGGKRARSGSSTSRTSRPKTGEPPQIDLRKTPSLSHRYQIKRSSSIPTIPSPSTETAERFPSVQPTHVEEESEQTDASKKTDIEQEQAKFEEEMVATRPRKTSDVPSVTSSTGASVDQQKLDKLRDSSRISHSTVATTVASSASRTNSMSSTPPTDLKELLEGQQEVAIAKLPYRSLSSYSLATKRRSVAPLYLQEQPLLETSKPLSVMEHHKKLFMEVSVESPILGRHPTPSEASLTVPKKGLSEARSVPNLKTVDDDKHDSKMPIPPMADLAERPESFVGDLPDPTTWAIKPSPSHRTSLLHGHGHTSPEILAQRAAERSSMTRPLRAGSHSFSLPLRVNPQDPSSQRPVIKRSSQSADTDAGVRSPIPAATTLVAKVDIATRTTIDACNIPKRLSSTQSSPPRQVSATGQIARRGSSARLSLFPTSTTPPGPPPGFPLPTLPLNRPPSMAGMNGLAAHPPNGGTLRRPTSLQVRSDHAPFLSSIRVSPTSGAGSQFRATTTPIRSLKPSRSVGTMQTVHQGAAMAPQSFKFSDDSSKITSEATDQATPLPSRSDSPPKDPHGIPLPLSRPSSRARKCRTSASLPELDFGLPLVGLGPPAPPPQAPLPQLPTESRPASRTEGPTMRTGTPIGVAIGEAIDKDPAGGVVVGLGIEVS